MMTVIGIDYSMNSVGICVYRNKKYEFYSVLNTYSLTSSTKEDIHNNYYNHCSDDIKKTFLSLDDIELYTRKPNSLNLKKTHKSDKNNELNKWHRKTLVDSNHLSNTVIGLLIRKGLFNGDTKFVIENYITNRNGGDTTIQIIEFTKSFKDRLFEKVKLNNIFIVTAPEIKMLAGSGNYTKSNMFDAFINEKIDSKFIDYCKSNKKYLKVGSKDVKKPIDDVIDGYYLTKWYLEKMKKEKLSIF